MFASENQLGIEFIDRATCYSEIYREFILNNKPFVLSKNFTETWPCRKLWVKDGKPNWDYIKLHYGDSVNVKIAHSYLDFYNSFGILRWIVSPRCQLQCRILQLPPKNWLEIKRLYWILGEIWRKQLSSISRMFVHESKENENELLFFTFPIQSFFPISSQLGLAFL